MSRICSSRKSTQPTRAAISTPGGPAAVQTREETIEVRGGAPVKLTVRETRHGPVISDLALQRAKAGTVLALQTTWLGPDDRTPQALRGDRPRQELDRVSRRAETVRRAAAEHGVCRYRRRYRLYRAGAHPDPRLGRWLAAAAGLERRARLDRLHPVR